VPRDEQGLSAIIKEHYSKWLLYSVLDSLGRRKTINVYADIKHNGRPMKMLFDCLLLWATVSAIGMVWPRYHSYKHYVKFLK